MTNTNYLAHYGIQGQKWGIRRYQNADGSLTKAGRERYGYTGSYSEENYVEDLKTLTTNAKDLKKRYEPGYPNFKKHSLLGFLSKKLAV